MGTTDDLSTILGMSALARPLQPISEKDGKRDGKTTSGNGQAWSSPSGEDNIREWTGLEFSKSQRAVENRKSWRKLVVKSSVVPQ